jgi:peptidoglycan/xylan/chitin deacetylase (PgdA/CDA1 family)
MKCPFWAVLRLATFSCALAIASCSGVKSPDKPPKDRTSDKSPRRSTSAEGYSKGKEATTPVHASQKPAAHPVPDTQSPPQATTPADQTALAGRKDIIEVVLSFDDGPHVKPLGRGTNYTEKVFRTLKDNLLLKDIKAVFFVQTHAPGRGAAPTGQKLFSILAGEGHVIGIHTGSTADHASHCVRAVAPRYDANGNGVLDYADGANGLESDMIRAKARILKLTGRVPRYVRPTYGERNRTVQAVYSRQQLKMVLWDVVSGDSRGSPSVDEVNDNIRKGMCRCIAQGKTQVVILFHDINSRTAANLEEYIATICISARDLGKTVLFPTSGERVRQILDARTDK